MTNQIQRGMVVSRYVTATPNEAAEIAKRNPGIIGCAAKANRAEWLEVPSEWRDYAVQYSPDEALERAREAGGFGV